MLRAEPNARGQLIASKCGWRTGLRTQRSCHALGAKRPCRSPPQRKEELNPRLVTGLCQQRGNWPMSNLINHPQYWGDKAQQKREMAEPIQNDPMITTIADEIVAM